MQLNALSKKVKKLLEYRNNNNKKHKLARTCTKTTTSLSKVTTTTMSIVASGSIDLSDFCHCSHNVDRLFVKEKENQKNEN